MRSEAAEANFARLRDEVQKAVQESRRLTAELASETERARVLTQAAGAWAWDLIKQVYAKQSVNDCHCKGRLWVCQSHPEAALDECHCGAPAVPCSCNPYLGYLAKTGTEDR